MRKTNTKERLILAAMDLFSVKGYEGTSVDEIAKAVGIRAPSIYDHFKGKEALLQAISDHADEEYEKGMQFGKANALRICSREELKEYTMHSIQYTLNNEIMRKMRRMLTIEQFRNEMFSERATRHHITTYKDIYSEVFKRMMDIGVMQKGNPDIYALEYIAPVTLMIQLCDREPNRKEEVLKIIDQHIDVFTHKYFI